MRRRRRPKRRSVRRIQYDAPDTSSHFESVSVKGRARRSDPFGPSFGLGSVYARTDDERETSNPRSQEIEEEVAAGLSPIRTEEEGAYVPPAHGRTLTLHGTTMPGPFNFSPHTEDLEVSRAEGCQNCTGGDCLRVQGTLVTAYSVSPTVRLPSVSDYPDLTPCQQSRVRDAITNVLAPHEQQHVAAFEAYNGTTRRSFDITICRSQWNEDRIRAMARSEQRARQRAAQAASDALDPFSFTVDLDCQEPTRPHERDSPSEAPTDDPLPSQPAQGSGDHD